MKAVAANAFSTDEMTENFHTLGEEVGAGEFGAAACAGAIMVVLSNLLMRYKLYLKATSRSGNASALWLAASRSAISWSRASPTTSATMTNGRGRTHRPDNSSNRSIFWKRRSIIRLRHRLLTRRHDAMRAPISSQPLAKTTSKS